MATASSQVASGLASSPLQAGEACSAVHPSPTSAAPPDPEEKEKKPLTVNDLLKKRKKKNNQFDIKDFMFFECINDKIEAFLVSIAKFPGTSRTPQGVGWDRDRVAPSPELRGHLELPAM